MKYFFQKQTIFLVLLCLMLSATANADIPDNRFHPLYKVKPLPASGELVVIDGSVENYGVLVKIFEKDRPVYILDRNRDGLQQLTEVLNQYQHLQALHIISHGAPGELLLGKTRFLPADTPHAGNMLKAVRNSLSGDGDILIYGCNFGAGIIGKKGVQALAELTGADVAASTNITGNNRFNGDWKLELQVGKIESSPMQADSWLGALIHCWADCQEIPHQEDVVGDEVGDNEDGDELIICKDPCPNDPNNLCEADLCPNDPLKVAPGVCGCGRSDDDYDVYNDQNQNCQTDDNDGDGATYQCHDLCPNDPNKQDPGVCGCGIVEDINNDGIVDCGDLCPNDPNKTEPGTCGCGFEDIDINGDGIADCGDLCPDNPLKTEPGICGCGVADTDTDGDGTPDCNDECPHDMSKTVPGTCGCGNPDTDSDNDGVLNCNDNCPQDMNKLEPGICGCGVVDSDVDENNNGVPDCRDFPWILYLHNFYRNQPVCGETPDYCYMVADGDNLNSENSELLKYNFDTGSLEMIGRLGVGMVEAITLSLDGTVLYATNNGTLGIIDTSVGSTQAFTSIKSGGIGSGNGSMGTVVFSDIDGLAFDPTTGILYGSERRADNQRGVDLLVKIDHHTGTLIKDGFGTGVDYVVINTEAIGLYDTDDMTFDSNGILYGLAAISGGGGGDRLVIIDKQTGQVTNQGELRSATAPVQDLEGLTFYHGSSLYGTTGFEFPNRGTTNTLYRIDKATGTSEAILRLDQNFNGLIPNDFESIACPICK